MHVLEILQRLAQGGRAVVTTIHQPSSRLYATLDKLLLLSKVRACSGAWTSLVPSHRLWHHSCMLRPLLARLKSAAAVLDTGCHGAVGTPPARRAVLRGVNRRVLKGCCGGAAQGHALYYGRAQLADEFFAALGAKLPYRVNVAGDQLVPAFLPGHHDAKRPQMMPQPHVLLWPRQHVLSLLLPA